MSTEVTAELPDSRGCRGSDPWEKLAYLGWLHWSPVPSQFPAPRALVAAPKSCFNLLEHWAKLESL